MATKKHQVIQKQLREQRFETLMIAIAEAVGVDVEKILGLNNPEPEEENKEEE